MTHDEIDKLGAGPEINALVAEGMGKLRRSGSWYEVESPRSGWISGFHGKKEAMEWLGHQYPYSEDISVAWGAVEKLELLGHTVVVTLKRHLAVCDLYTFQSVKKGEATKAPLAICRAFLKTASA